MQNPQGREPGTVSYIEENRLVVDHNKVHVLFAKHMSRLEEWKRELTISRETKSAFSEERIRGTARAADTDP
jgi:hypothetical protein